MNLNTIFLKSFRILFFPFSVIYGLVIIIRNFLYNKNILKSSAFNFPLICVGNLSAGGTGKSPMVEYLVQLLKDEFKVATVSRGYKRKTKGYVLANENTTALEIGDEPMQFHLKFPDVPVAVGEERIVAIPQLLHDKPDTQAIILDDAFQHRSIKPGFNILLTAYNDLYTDDFFLPTGDLRDSKSSAKRAQVIVITKCPDDLSEEEQKTIIEKINPEEDQQVYFTTIEYSMPYHITTHQPKNISAADEVLLVCGIANPRPLKKFLQSHTSSYTMITYSDHHIFTIDDIRDITRKFDAIKSSGKYILTTEKDAVRLLKFAGQLNDLPMYVIPVRHRFLSGADIPFNEAVQTFIRNFNQIQPS